MFIFRRLARLVVARYLDASFFQLEWPNGLPSVEVAPIAFDYHIALHTTLVQRRNGFSGNNLPVRGRNMRGTPSPETPAFAFVPAFGKRQA
jgi:hypothetical protein